MSPDNSVADREAQAHAAFVFSGEERIENAQTNVFGHARSSIAYRNLDRVTFLPGGESKDATLRHCVDGVKDHIDQDFPQFRFITHDHGTAVELKIEADVHVE